MSYNNFDPFFDDEPKDNEESSQTQTQQNNSQSSYFFLGNNGANNPFENNESSDNDQNRQIKTDNDNHSSDNSDGNSNLPTDNSDRNSNLPTDNGSPNNGGGYYGNGGNNGNGGNFGGGNNGGYYNYGNGNGGATKKKKSPTLGIILAVIIPILIITNILTSILVFNNVWKDARTEFEAELNNIVSKENDYVLSNNTMLSYNIAKQEMKSVVEIYSTTSVGSSAGTGFVVTADGYILTNAHVVTYQSKSIQGIGPAGGLVTTTNTAEKVVIQFEGNETQYPVEVIAYDTTLDLAVLKIKNPPQNLRPVKFADSTLLSFGEPCVAIGNAKGYGLAVTEGVISSPIQYYNLTSRDNALTAAVQHSAAINPGNSGGPLFNMFGLVVGINSFKLTSATDEVALDGMGFAIPSAVVKDYVNGLNINGLKITYTPNPVIETLN